MAITDHYFAEYYSLEAADHMAGGRTSVVTRLHHSDLRLSTAMPIQNVT